MEKCKTTKFKGTIQVFQSNQDIYLELKTYQTSRKENTMKKTFIEPNRIEHEKV